MAIRPAFDALLGPGERVEGRPFTSPAATEADAGTMREMLTRVRAVILAWGSEPPPSGSVLEHDHDGHRHWLVVPEPAALAGASDVTAVGFFGQRREGRDDRVLFDLEAQIVASFPEYARMGLLSYYDVEFAGGRYGNLILFATPDVPPAWYENEAHERAVQISPLHYTSIRLHKGHVAGPLAGDGDLTIERTKYLDFGDPAWRGLRQFAEAN